MHREPGAGDMRQTAAGDAPPLFFVLPKKSRRARWKRKRLYAAKPRPCGLRFAWRGGCWLDSAAKVRQPSAECALFRRWNNCFPTGRVAAETSDRQGLAPAPLSALSASLSAARVEFRKGPLSPGDEVQNKGARRPPWSGRVKGVRGEFRNPPGFLFRGCGALSLFKRESTPQTSPHPWERVPPTVGKRCPQASSRQRGILIHLGPPRPRLSSAQGMVWMRMPSSSSRRLVTWLRE